MKTYNDAASLQNLLDACKNNRPRERFVAFDGDGQASVILLFGDGQKRDFVQGHFSTPTAAFSAFAQVEELVDKIDAHYAEMCPL